MGKREAEEIKKTIEKIKKFKERNRFERVILFGSYARGDFDKNSDIDLVIADKRFRGKNVFDRSRGLWIEWHHKQKIGKPVDFLCYTPEEIEKLKKKVSIVSEAIREGIEI